EIPETEGTFELYVVFPEAQARLNWLHFGVADDPGPDPDPDPDPELPACLAPSTDDFDGDALDSRWTVVEPDEENLSVADGALSIQTVPGRDFFQGDGTLPNVVVQPLPDGAWTATAKMSWNPTQNFQNAGLVVWTDDNNYVKAGQVWSGSRNFELITELGGSATFNGTVAAPAGFPTDYWIRYVHDGTTLTAQFSADGSSWTTIGTTSLSGLVAPGVGVYATN